VRGRPPPRAAPGCWRQVRRVGRVAFDVDHRSVRALTSRASEGNLYGWDPDGDPLTLKIEWGAGAAPEYGPSSWPNYYDFYSTHRYSTTGTYTVWGTATDNYGASGYASRSVRVCTFSYGSFCL